VPFSPLVAPSVSPPRPAPLRTNRSSAAHPGRASRGRGHSACASTALQPTSNRHSGDGGIQEVTIGSGVARPGSQGVRASWRRMCCERRLWFSH
jgi:hypothetical protein